MNAFNEEAPAMTARGASVQKLGGGLRSNDTAISNSTPAVTSSEIADLVGSRHDDVKRSIERLANRGVIEFPPMAEIPTATKPMQVFRFTGERGKRDSIVVVAQLSPEVTARLVDRWAELERLVGHHGLRAPGSLKEALRLALEQAERLEVQAMQIERQAEAIEHQRPAVDFVAKYVQSSGTKSIREAAKHCGVKEGEFIEWLVLTDVLFRQHEKGPLLPRAGHQHAGRFVLRTGLNTESHIWTQTRFTARGLAWIAARWEKKKAADAALTTTELT